MLCALSKHMQISLELLGGKSALENVMFFGGVGGWSVYTNVNWLAKKMKHDSTHVDHNQFDDPIPLMIVTNDH